MARYRFDEIAINVSEKKKPTAEDQKLYVGLEHLDSGSLVVSRWGSNVPIKGEKLIMRKGDVLLGKRNAYLRRAAIAPHDGIFSAHGMVLRPNEDIVDRNFFPFFISSDYFFDEAVRISVGSLSPTVNWSDLRRLEFDLPDMAEQRKLARVLWAVNDTIEAYKRLMSATEELVRGQFAEWIEGRYPEIILGDEIETTSGGTPLRKKLEYYEGGTIPWLTSSEVNKGIINHVENYITQEGLQNSSAKWIPAGSVVIAMYGATAGTVGLLQIATTTNQAVCSLLPNDEFDPLYLYHAVSSKRAWMIANTKGAAQPNISQTVIKTMKIVKPPMSVQQQFADFVHQADKSKSSLQKALTAARNISRKIISENLG